LGSHLEEIGPSRAHAKAIPWLDIVDLEVAVRIGRAGADDDVRVRIGVESAHLDASHRDAVAASKHDASAHGRGEIELEALLDFLILAEAHGDRLTRESRRVDERGHLRARVEAGEEIASGLIRGRLLP